MTPDDLTTRATAFPDVTEEQPFGDSADVFKVHGKIFAILESHVKPPRVTLKCEPEQAEILRDRYPAVTPGYHMPKRHWNSVLLDGSIPSDEVEDMLEHSYREVVAGLSRATRDRIALFFPAGP